MATNEASVGNKGFIDRIPVEVRKAGASVLGGVAALSMFTGCGANNNTAGTLGNANQNPAVTGAANPNTETNSDSDYKCVGDHFTKKNEHGVEIADTESARQCVINKVDELVVTSGAGMSQTGTEGFMAAYAYDPDVERIVFSVENDLTDKKTLGTLCFSIIGEKGSKNCG